VSDIITTSAGQRINQQSRVTLHFAVLLESGEEIDTTRRGRPATFEVGDGSLLVGFEEALFGMRAGDDAQILLEPAQAFGEHRRENVQLLPRERFAGVTLEPGLIVSFSAPDGELPGVVLRLFEQTVEVDFNHPLAGRRVIFDVSIVEVTAAGDPAGDVASDSVTESADPSPAD
jgi:FKBP-type peptidyl-prolyl cis-trans isomerase SlpA